MNKFKINVIYILLLSFILNGCKKEGRLDHIMKIGPAPEQVSDINIEPTAGGAIISYKLPKDTIYSYLEADYEIQEGVYRQAKSSRYSDTIRLIGFGDTLRHVVQLYSVGKNLKKSEPISVYVNPLKPPVFSVYDSLVLKATFGGVQLSFKNPTMAKLSLRIIIDKSGLGDWEDVETFYTGAKEGTFSVRGFKTVKQKFGVFVRDRWDNKSDTLIKNLTPIFEEKIPKNTWSAYELPTDQVEIAGANYPLKQLWNGRNSWANGDYPYASSNAATVPQWFTIDLGVEVKMSRVVMHQAPRTHLYEGSAPKTVQIWGSDHPNKDGSWASWDSLGTFHSFKPSGLPLGQTSDEDKQYGAVQGESFEFNHLLPAYRYLRWKTLETYGGGRQVVFGEIDVYGQIVN